MKSILNKRGLAFALSLGLAAAVAGCSGQPSSTYADAQQAFEQNQFRVARIHLANVMSGGSVDAKTNLLQAKLMLELGDGIAAETAIAKLPKDAVTDGERRALLTHSYIMQGKAKKTTALYEAMQSEKLSEQDFRMFIWAYREQGRSNEANEILRLALETYPESKYFQTFAGSAALDKGDTYAAAEFAEKALKYGPKDYEALVLNGRVKIFQGDLKAARGFYAKASEYYPDHGVPLANMAGLDLDLGDLKSAEKVIKKGMQHHSRFPFMLFQKARLSYEKGDYEAARYAIEEAKDAYDNYTPLMLLAGKVEAKLGNPEFAIRELSRVLANEPGNEEAQKLLAELK